jgi:hypothetical protein
MKLVSGYWEKMIRLRSHIHTMIQSLYLVEVLLIQVQESPL